jgi:hypothetical protein
MTALGVGVTCSRTLIRGVFSDHDGDWRIEVAASTAVTLAGLDGAFCMTNRDSRRIDCS